MHDSTTYGDRAYVAWRDKGIIILDISNIARPTRIGELNWADVSRPEFNPLPGQTHSVGVVLPSHDGRAETVMCGDEIGFCPGGYLHLIDVRIEARPMEISNFMLPSNMGGNCPYDPSFGSIRCHDVERMIRGNICWSAWESGGFWGIDFSDVHDRIGPAISFHPSEARRPRAATPTMCSSRRAASSLVARAAAACGQ